MNLFELNRLQLVNIIKDQTPSRHKSRLNVTIGSKISIDPGSFRESGSLRITIPVEGKTSNYDVTIGIEDYLNDLIFTINRASRGERRDAILQSIRYAFQMYDMRVHCTCPDFYYRFEYNNNQKDALVTPPGDESILPAQITNPDNQGAGCKHVSHVISNYSRWSSKLITQLNQFIRDNEFLLSR